MKHKDTSLDIGVSQDIESLHNPHSIPTLEIFLDIEAIIITIKIKKSEKRETRETIIRLE